MKKSLICMISLFFIVSLTFNGKVGAEETIENEHWKDFTNDFFKEKIENEELVGVTLSVVEDGELIFLKGYGYSDLEKQIEMDPSNTTIRAGSIGKSFTVTSIMQLAEQGMLDLNDSVWEYIDVDMPQKPKHSITIHDLLTHTPGFEESFSGFFANSKDDVSNEYYIKNYMPKQKNKPGAEVQYSNYGMGLLGKVVEDVSNMPLHKYIEKNIFEPLNMQESTFIQDHQEEQLAKSYHGKTEFPYHYFHITGAGALTTTSEDMAKYMNAHLNKDALSLNSNSFFMMHNAQYKSMDGMIGGVTYGFFEKKIGSQNIIHHGGDIDAFTSDMILFKDEGVGLFISFNSVLGIETITLRNNYLEEFVERKFGNNKVDVIDKAKQKTSREILEQYEGKYERNRVIESGPAKIQNLIPNPNDALDVEVDVYDNGKFKIDDLRLSNQEIHFIETNDDMVFKSEDGQYTMGFSSENGKIKMVNSEYPMMEYYKSSPINEKSISSVIALLIIIWSLFYILYYLFGFIYKKIKNKSQSLGKINFKLFLISISLPLSLVAITQALDLITFGQMSIAKALLISPYIPVLLIVWTIYSWNKADKTEKKNKKVSFMVYIWSFVIALWLLLCIYWEVTPFHV